MFSQTTQRFSETLQGMRQMAAEMQRELEATRNELRRGILELPQETADSAAQMRRVIVDQIEALAELNRIVARHGRGLDAAEPPRRAPEPVYANAGGGGQPRMEAPRRRMGNGMPPPPRRHHRRRADAAAAPRRCALAHARVSPGSRPATAGSPSCSPRLQARRRRPRRRAPGRATRWNRSTRSPSISRG